MTSLTDSHYIDDLAATVELELEPLALSMHDVVRSDSDETAEHTTLFDNKLVSSSHETTTKTSVTEDDSRLLHHRRSIHETSESNLNSAFDVKGVESIVRRMFASSK